MQTRQEQACATFVSETLISEEVVGVPLEGHSGLEQIRL